MNLLETVENKENVTIDLCFNMLQHFEKIDTEKIKKHELIIKFKKGVAITGFTVALVNKNNGSAVTSGTPTIKITKDGGTQGTLSGSATHEGNGQWSFNLTATETDASVIGLMITHADAMPVQKTIITWGE